jgi:hypothetical protein
MFGKKSPEPRREVRDVLVEMQDELTAVTTSLGLMNDMLDQLAETQRDLAGQVTRLQANLDEVDRNVRTGLDQVSSLTPLVQRHEDDLEGRLAEATAGRQDIGSEQHRDQQDTWKQFDDIVRRPVTHVVNEVLRRDGRIKDKAAKARLVAHVVRLLVPGGPADGLTGTEELVRAIGEDQLRTWQRDVAQILDAAGNLGMAPYWGPVAERPELFEDWPSSAPTGPTLVVVPAWVADGRQIGAGRVYRA